MVVMLAAPILPGRAEAWRRLCQELAGSRAEAFAASACGLGIRSLRAWVLPGARGEIALIGLDAAHPADALAELAASSIPFDRWLCEQIRLLLGVDLAMVAETHGELVFTWNKEI